MQNPIRRSYVAGTITLASGGVNYNLWILIRDLIESQKTGAGAEVPGTSRELQIQAADGNTANIYVGDGNLTPTNCGYVMVFSAAGPGASRTYRSGPGSYVGVQDLYVQGGIDGQKINIEICTY